MTTIHISGLEPQNETSEYMAMRLSSFTFYWGYVSQVLNIIPEILVDPYGPEILEQCQEVRQYDKEQSEQIANEIFDRIRTCQLHKDIINSDYIHGFDPDEVTNEILKIIDKFSEMAEFCRNSGGINIVLD